MRNLFLACVVICFVSPANATDDGRSPPNGRMPGATPEEVQATLSHEAEFSRPAPLAFSVADIQSRAITVKAAYGSLDWSLGDLAEKYDVVIQPGHYLRKPGDLDSNGKQRPLGGNGKFVSEQEIAAWVTRALLAELLQRKLKAVAIPADKFNKPLTAKIFLALHTDSASLPCRVGPSVAYPGTASSETMHMIALALATSLDLEPAKFMRDNYTKNEAQYYAYNEINAETKGLLEMGELSCEEDEAKLIQNGTVLAKNLAKAILLELRSTAVK